MFNYVSAFEVESTWIRLTDTAKITLPRKLNLNGVNIRDVIRPGDEVKIEAGYRPGKALLFEGYIREVDATVPVTITCEDQMYKLKSINSIDKAKVNAWRNISLRELITRLVPSIQADCMPIQIGAYRLTEDTVAKELDMLRQRLGIYSYFRSGVLKVGFPYALNLSARYKFTFRKNIIDSDLQYQIADNKKIKIKAINLRPDGTKTTHDTGDSDGELRTLYYTNVTDVAMKKMAEEDLKRMKVSGYSGSFSAKGYPVVRHGDIVELFDPELPERSGSYIADKVVVSFSTSTGLNQRIYPGKKI